MTNRFKIVGLAAVSCSLSITGAVAADEGPTDQDGTKLEEIVVSAQKRSESLQDVPISVTAFSQEKLNLMGATNLSGIQQSTPNLDFAVQSGAQNNAKVTLRGVGTETLDGGGDPGVALHVNGIYVGRNSAAAVDMYDVERVEILRGPQGTLFGRNANGGSVNIVTKRPTQDFEVTGDLTYGSYSWMRARGAINLPLSDTLAARVTLTTDQRDGYVENLWPSGRDGGDKSNSSVRAQLAFNPDAGGEYLLRGYYTSMNSAGAPTRYLRDDLTTADRYPANYAVGISSGPVPPAGLNVLADPFRRPSPAVGNPVLAAPSGFYRMRKDAPEFIDQVISGVDLEASWPMFDDSALLRSLTSYQTNDNELLSDTDNSELAIETRARTNNAHQFSQEFNLLSQQEGALDWIVGAFFYNESLTEQLVTRTPAQLLPLTYMLPAGAVPGGGGVGQTQTQHHELTSYAFFAQGTYSFTDALRLTLGMRYTSDDKDQSRFGGGRLDLTTGVRFNGGGAIGPFPPDGGSTTQSEPTYKAVLDYKFQNANMVYASYSRGFKSGGYDFNGGVIDADGELIPYEPETVDAYEIGSKNRMFDERVELNLAAFYYDYKNLQTTRLTGEGPRTDNAAASEIKGVEAEFVMLATEALRFDASVGYLDATYTEFVVEFPPPAVDYSGNQLNNAPEWTVHAGAQYTWPAFSEKMTARLDWSWRDDTYFDRVNGPFDVQEAYSLVNARLRYEAEKWYVDVFASNLLGEEYVTSQLINPPFNCGCRAVALGAPAMYGVTFGFNY